VAGALRAVATAGGGQSSGVTTLTITVPTTGAGGSVVAGDYALITVGSFLSTPVPSTPSGWTLLQSGNAGGGAWLYGKTLVSGDIGASVSFTFSSAVRADASMVVGSGVTATGMASAVLLESSSTSTPTLPSLAGVASGSLVVAFMSRRRQSTPAPTVTVPGAYTPQPQVSTGYGSSPEMALAAGTLVQPSTGSAGGESGSSSQATGGTNFLVALPASTTGGSGATVALATATATVAVNPLTVSGDGPSLAAIDTSWPPFPYRQALRSGGFDLTYTVSATLGGVPVQGAQNLQPTGGTIVDTTKPGSRWVLNLELAPEIVNGQQIYDLLTPVGTRLTATAHVKYPDQSVFDIPMGVYVIGQESVTEGGGALQVTAPDKWQLIANARFLVPQASTPGIPVTQQIVQLIQGALGGQETVNITATSSATVGALTWDRDRDKAILDLAASIGAWVYFDRTGQCTIADIPTIGASADWLIDAGQSGVAISLDRHRSREGTYNVVVVSSSASGGEAFDPVYVWDGDPSSPTYAGTDPLANPGSAGPFGIVPTFYSSPVLSSVGEARNAGLSILARTIGLSSQVSLSAVPNPALEAFQVLDVLPPDIAYGPTRVLERHVADTVTHPLALGTGSPQQIQGRSTRTDFTSDVSG
jgi:hypothetical protein